MIQKFNHPEARPFPVEGVSKINSIARDGHRDFWFTDEFNHRILKYDSDGNYISSFGTRGSNLGQLNYPTGLLVNGQNLWVCDSWNHRIVIFDLEGNPQSSFGSSGSGPRQFQCPSELEPDGTGGAWVLDRGNERIVHIDCDLQPGRVLQVNRVLSHKFNTLDTDKYREAAKDCSAELPAQGVPSSLKFKNGFLSVIVNQTLIILDRDGLIGYRGDIPLKGLFSLVDFDFDVALIHDRSGNRVYSLDLDLCRLNTIYNLDSDTALFWDDYLYVFDGQTRTTLKKECVVDLIPKRHFRPSVQSFSVDFTHLTQSLLNALNKINPTAINPTSIESPLCFRQPLDKPLESELLVDSNLYTAVHTMKSLCRLLSYAPSLDQDMRQRAIEETEIIYYKIVAQRFKLITCMARSLTSGSTIKFREATLADTLLFLIEQSFFILNQALDSFDNTLPKPYIGYLREPQSQRINKFIAEIHDQGDLTPDYICLFPRFDNALDCLEHALPYYEIFVISSLLSDKMEKARAITAWHCLDQASYWCDNGDWISSLPLFTNPMPVIKLFSWFPSSQPLTRLWDLLKGKDIPRDKTYQLLSWCEGHHAANYEAAARLLQSQSDEPTVSRDLALLDAFQGNLKRAFDRMGTSQDHNFLAKICDAAGNYSMSITFLKTNNFYKTKPHLCLRLVQDYICNYQLGDALHILDDANIDNARNIFYRAIIHTWHHNFFKAEIEFNRLPNRTLENVWLHKAILARMQKKFTECLESLNKEMYYYPKWNIEIQRFLTFIAMERFEDAKKTLDRVTPYAYLFRENTRFFVHQEGIIKLGETYLKIEQSPTLYHAMRTRCIAWHLLSMGSWANNYSHWAMRK